MIKANLKGQLGNQMFQIAAGLSLAEDEGKDFACNGFNYQHMFKHDFNKTKHFFFKTRSN